MIVHGYDVEIMPLPSGDLLVTVPALPGCMTQAETYEQALGMASEIIEGYLDILREDGDLPKEK